MNKPKMTPGTKIAGLYRSPSWIPVSNLESSLREELWQFVEDGLAELDFNETHVRFAPGCFLNMEKENKNE